MDASVKKRLVGVDVANARDNLLSQQHGLDRSLATGEPALQNLNGKFGTQRLRSQASQGLFLAFGRPEFDATKLARVVKKQAPSIHEIETDAAMREFGAIIVDHLLLAHKRQRSLLAPFRGGRRAGKIWSSRIPGPRIRQAPPRIDLPARGQQVEIAGHAPVDRHQQLGCLGAAQIKEQVFATPAYLENALAADQRAKGGRVRQTNRALPENMDIVNSSAQHGGAKLARGKFDLWQFRHKTAATSYVLGYYVEDIVAFSAGEVTIQAW